MGCSLPGFSVHGIFQARTLEWFAIFFSRGSSQARDQTRVSHTEGRLFTVWATRKTQLYSSIQFSSVIRSYPTLYDPVNHSMPGLPVHHQLLESTETHVHWVSDAIQPSHPLLTLLLLPLSFPASESFQMSQLFAWGSQSIGVSTSTSVLPMNTQDWSPLGWTSCISLQSKGLSRVFSNTTVQKHQFFGSQLS